VRGRDGAAPSRHTRHGVRSMRLINQTALPSMVTTGSFQVSPKRIGAISAKATFRFDSSGKVELETQAPVPIFSADSESPEGTLPQDLQPRTDHRFAVILLGHAYPPGGKPTAMTTAALTVGDVRREIAVFGDRVWVPDGSGKSVPGPPTPFAKMPLTYGRAFGGTIPIRLDERSIFDLSDVYNKHGIGFDAERHARGLCLGWNPPPGYPALPPGYERPLPNLEDPRELIRDWDDTPLPSCWATVPIDVALWEAWVIKNGIAPPSQPTLIAQHIPSVTSCRAHPDWVLPTPKAAPHVVLENLLPSTPRLAFDVPPFGVVADYTINGRYGKRNLQPQMLVLQPDQQKFYIVFHMLFNFEFWAGDEREFRLRLEPQWSDGVAS
jgi:Uncharacterized protein conserved in bacteria (DUF2169)